jgi:hypothetical protein
VTSYSLLWSRQLLAVRLHFFPAIHSCFFLLYSSPLASRSYRRLPLFELILWLIMFCHCIGGVTLHSCYACNCMYALGLRGCIELREVLPHDGFSGSRIWWCPHRRYGTLVFCLWPGWWPSLHASTALPSHSYATSLGLTQLTLCSTKIGFLAFMLA